MTIQLRPDQEQAIQAAIAAGQFRSVDEFIESAIRTLTKAIEPSKGSEASGDERLPPSWANTEGVWVHQGVAEPGAAWDRIIDDVREELASQPT